MSLRLRKVLVSMVLSMAVLFIPFSVGVGSSTVVVSASDLEDNLEEYSSEDTLEDDIQSEDNGVADLFKNHRAMTSEQLDAASRTLSPITNFIGYIIGGIMVLMVVGIFLITALDLLYIGVPPLRGILYKGAQDEMQGGGMMGTYGRGMGGNVQRGLRFQLISDEAVQCSQLIGGGQQSAGGGMPGGYMSNNYASPQNEMSNKSVILVYFKKRVIFMIFFAVCAVMLTSSIFLGTGINIAQWLTRMVNMINNFIPS